MRIFTMIASILTFSSMALGASPKDIIDENTQAVIYLEVRDAAGGVLESGTGFVVSHDGFVLTVAHMKVDPTQKLWAVVGQREGTAFPLSFREKDENSDTALWQFPQSQVCRESVVISSQPVEMLDPVLALGFPGSSGLTPSGLTINNLQTQRGFFRTDGFLEAGNSGGPVFNQAGKVIGIVHGGGQPGTENNEIIPIALAMSLVRKRNVAASVDVSQPYADACYAVCSNERHGIASWNEEVTWSESTGWMDGGHNPTTECAIIANSIKTRQDAGAVKVTSTGESSKKDIFGHVEYKYHCSGVVLFGPIYVSKRSPACGLWK